MPNKETVRRICILNQASYCYILLNTDTSIVKVFTDVKKTKRSSLKKELEDWCGVNFEVFTSDAEKFIVKDILTNGEKILPIDL